jgi:hypothetical protein
MFEPDKITQELAVRLKAFMAHHVYPNEAR